jgi:transposase
LELTLEELETKATEDELAAEMAAAKAKTATTTVASFSRQRTSRKPFPEHLRRERVIVPGPVSCACCGGARLSKLGEDVTETLEVIPKSWKVILIEAGKCHKVALVACARKKLCIVNVVVQHGT